jgi:hypothetical protein
MPHATKELYLLIELNIALAILQLGAQATTLLLAVAPLAIKTKRLAFEGWQGSTNIVATLKLTKIA